MTHILHIALPQFEVFIVALVRIGAILSAFPLLGARTLPTLVKAGLAVALALTMMPFVPPVSVPADMAVVGLGLAAEFLVGLVIGLVVRSLFAGFEVAGEVMGSQMGLGVAQLVDPTSAQQTPVLAHFQATLASLLFLALNLHLGVVHAIGESFRVIPPYGAALSPFLVDDVLQAFQGMFRVAVKLAAPVMVVTLVVNLVMALLGRAVSQLNVFVLSFPLTIAVGLLALGIALPAMAGVMTGEFESMMRTLDAVMRVLGHG